MLTLDTFRLNGALIALGDALVAPLGLTSARWQVMGAVVEAQGALPVAGIARNMGLVRQSVQRIADELAALGLMRFAENPHHRRAKLVQLTEAGAALFADANARWTTAADALVAELGADEVERAAAFLRLVRTRVEALHPSRAADAPSDLIETPEARHA